MEALEDILIPIFICVVLPVAIVALVAWQRINSDNKRAQVLLKAIEANNSVDTDKLAEALNRPKKTDRQTLFSRLLWGCIFTLGGVACEIYAIIAACTIDTNVSSSDPIEGPGIFGGLSLALGIAFLIVYFVTRKQVLAEDKKD